MRALVVINPIAGRHGRRAATPLQRIDLARRILASHGVDAEAVLTTRAAHAEELARAGAIDGYDVVFAWGGDGTVNETARGLAFTDTALAIIPAGSGNGLARALGIPPDPAAAIAHALRARERRIDTGTLAGRFFANVSGVGLDAEVATRFNQRPTGRRGPLPYVALAIGSAASYRAREYRLTFDDETLTERALIVALANSPEYGNGAIVAPGAVPDDGLLDVIVIRDRSLVGRLLGARRLLDGSLQRAPGVVHRRVRRLVIETEGDRVPFHVDGDAAEGPSKLEGIVQPGALKIRA